MLRKVFAAVLVLFVFFGTFKEAVIYFSFRMNQNYIAANLCINRDKVASTCQGKCMLKQFIQSNQDEDQQPLRLPALENRQNLIFIPIDFSLFYPKNINTADANFYAWSRHRSRNYISEIFHPPQV